MPGRINYSDNSTDDDETGFDDGDDLNREYDTYLSKSNIPSRTSLIFSGLAATVLTASFVITLSYILISGKVIYDDDGKDCTTFFLIFFGFLSGIFLMIFHVTRLKYKATYGTTNLLEDPDFANTFSNLPQWEEVNGPVTNGSHGSVLFPVVFTAVCVLVSFAVFVYSLVKTLAMATPSLPTEDLNQYLPHLGVVLSLLALGVFGLWLKKTVNKYMYYRRFSHEPMIEGSYYGNGHTE